MELTSFFAFEYLEKKEILSQTNLLLQQRYQISMPKGGSYFILIVPEKTVIDTIDFWHNKIFMGGYSYHLYDQLVHSKTEKMLTIFPTYYVYKGTYQRVFGLYFTGDGKEMYELLVWLVQQKNILIKIIVDDVEVKAFEQKVEQLLRVITSTQTSYSPLKRQRKQVKENEVENFFKAYTSERKTYQQIQIIGAVTTNNLQSLKKYWEKIKYTVERGQGTIDSYLFRQRLGIEQLYLQRTRKEQPLKQTFIDQKQLPYIIPLAELGLFDEKGKLIGYDFFDNPVFIDLWVRKGQRVNSNFIVLGQSGQGKTTLIKTMLYTEKKLKQFILDPENEYTFAELPADEYEKIYLQQHTIFAELFNFETLATRHIDFIIEHFHLRTKATYVLQETFRKILYTFREKPQKSLADLVKYIKENKTIPPIIQQYVEELYRKKVIDIHSDKRVVHYVIVDLMNQTSEQSKLFLFEVLHFIWLELAKENKLKKMLVIDEGYLFFQGEGNYLIELLRNMFKRIRKYNGAIGIVTQNIADFLNPEYRHALTTIFDNATYKFLFYQGEEDYEIMKQLVHLDNKNLKALKACRRGECLLCIGEYAGKIKIKQYV